MCHLFVRGFAAALLAAAVWSTSWGQAGIPPGQKPPKANKPPLASKVQPARPPMPPPGPKPEDFLKLLFPPEPAGGEDVESAPRRGSSGPSSRGPTTVSQADDKPSIPSDSEVRGMSAKQQQLLLRQAVASLDGDLGRMSSAEHWKNFLQIDPLGSALWCQSDPDPDEQSQKVLQLVGERMQQVESEPKFQAVRNLWGFQMARAVLPDYAAGAVKKEQRSMQASVATLNKALDAQANGPGWKKHLKVYELERIAAKAESPNDDDGQVLQFVAEKHDEVEKDPQFRSVAALPGFAASRDAARRMVAALAKKKMQPTAERGSAGPSERPDTAQMEKMVAGLLNQLKVLKQKCSEEHQAQQAVAAVNAELAARIGGDKLELARRNSEANETLRKIKEQHEAALRAAEDDLQKVLRAIKEGQPEPATILPLGTDKPSDKPMATILPLGTDKPSDKPAATILPLGTDKPSDKPEATILPLGTKPKEKEEKPKADEPMKAQPAPK